MKGKLFAFGLSLVAVATIGVVQLQTKAVDGSRDCDQFAVIRCGTMNGDELRAEYNSNNKNNSNGDTTEQSDIQKVFTGMGISKADLNGSFKQGVVYKNGDVKVDGKTVATGAMMAARGLGGTQIAGTNAQKVSVNEMSDAQTAMVKLDKDGKFLFAVMKPCGNPVSATPKVEPPKPEPTPTAECVSVKVVESKPAEYTTTATAKVTGGATIESYTFNLYRGGQEIMNKTYPSTKEEQSVVYAITDPGEYKVVTSVKTSEGRKTGPACEATFTRPPAPTPETPGVTIEKYVNNDQKYARVNADVEFSYRVVVTNTGSTDLNNVVVTDTADKGITLLSVTPPGGTITAPKDANGQYVFAYTIPKLLKGEARTFTLSAKVPVALAGKLVNTVCVDAPEVPGNPDKCDKAEVEVPPTPVPGKIEVCVLETKEVKMIDQATYDANPSLYSKNVADCKEEEVVTELPETGPAETVLSVMGAMSLVGSAAYYVASRRQSV